MFTSPFLKQPLIARWNSPGTYIYTLYVQPWHCSWAGALSALSSLPSPGVICMGCSGSCTPCLIPRGDFITAPPHRGRFLQALKCSTSMKVARFGFLMSYPSCISALRSPKGFFCCIFPSEHPRFNFPAWRCPGLGSLHLHLTRAACMEMLAAQDQLCSPMGAR